MQQATANRVFARDLGRRPLRTQALRNDRPLLLRRPSTAPLAAKNLHTPPHHTLTSYRTDVLNISDRNLRRQCLHSRLRSKSSRHPQHVAATPLTPTVAADRMR